MAWDQTLTSLNRTLAELYPEASQARRLAQVAGVPIAQIAFNARSLDNWYAVLVEAEHQGRVLVLAEAALEEYPASQQLKTAVEAVRRRAAPPGSGQPVVADLAAVDRRALRAILNQHFNDAELQELVFLLKADYGVEYDNLAGATKSLKIISLIEYFERRSIYPALVAIVRAERPDAFPG